MLRVPDTLVDCAVKQTMFPEPVELVHLYKYHRNKAMLCLTATTTITVKQSEAHAQGSAVLTSTIF